MFGAFAPGQGYFGRGSFGVAADVVVLPTGEPHLFTLYVVQRDAWTAAMAQGAAFTLSTVTSDTWTASVQTREAFELVIDDDDDWDAGR